MIIITGQFDNLAKNKPSTFYKLTKTGFEFFLNFKNCEPKEFWSALLWYYILKKDPLTDTRNLIKDPNFEIYCKKYYHQYIGKKIEDIYLLSDLLFFDSLYNRYHGNIFKPIKLSNDDISEYTGIMKSFIGDKPVYIDFDKEPILLNKIYHAMRSLKNEISDERKIIEALALNRYSSIEQISNNTDLTLDRVTKVIDGFIIDNYAPRSFSKKELEDEDEIIDEYLNFLSHNLILKSSIKKEKKYSLSLFSIILILKVWDEENKISEVNHGFKNIFGTAIRNFISITANNYMEKLPFIFGKLENIEKITHSEISELFKLIFDVERMKFYSTSIQFGGNKEIYDIINNVSVETSNKLYQIYREGKKIVESRLTYLDPNKQGQYRDVEKYYKKLIKHEIRKISTLLKYVNIENFVTKKDNYDPNFTSSGISLKKEQNIIENMLSKEITFLIFINWIKKGYGWGRLPFFYPINPKMRSINQNIEPLDKIQEIDKEINEQFLIWLNDSIEYNNKTTILLNSLVDEMTLNKIKE